MQAFVWVVVGIFLYLAIAAAAILHVYNMHSTGLLEFQFGEYFPSHRLGYLVTVERGIWAMASFVIWFRLLKCASPSSRALRAAPTATSAEVDPIQSDVSWYICINIYHIQLHLHLHVQRLK